MKNSPIRLYVDAQFASPYALSAFAALHEKNLPFELATVDLNQGINHGKDYAALSLTQRVPTLAHGEFSLSESSAIAEYLDEVFPEQPVYPISSHLRARVRQIQAWLRSDLSPLKIERSMESLFYESSPAPLSDAARDASGILFDACENLLSPGQENLFGSWSIADVDLATMLMRLIRYRDPIPGYLKDYAMRQWRRPTIQRWIALNRPALSIGDQPAFRLGDWLAQA